MHRTIAGALLLTFCAGTLSAQARARLEVPVRLPMGTTIRVPILVDVQPFCPGTADSSTQAELFFLRTKDFEPNRAIRVRLAGIPLSGSLKVCVDRRRVSFTSTGSTLETAPAPRARLGSILVALYRAPAPDPACRALAASRAPYFEWSDTSPAVRNCVSYWSRGRWVPCYSEGK